MPALSRDGGTAEEWGHTTVVWGHTIVMWGHNECTGCVWGPWGAGQEGSSGSTQRQWLLEQGCGDTGQRGRRRGRQPVSALTREGAAPGRPLGHPHARCQLHAGHSPDAFASPSPGCPRGMKGDARAQWHSLGSTSPCPPAWGHMGDTTSPSCSVPGSSSFRQRLGASGRARSYGSAEIRQWEVPYCSLCSILS